MRHSVAAPAKATERISIRADAALNVAAEEVAVAAAYDVGTGNSATSIRDALNVRPLYWSMRGEVACVIHVPGPSSHRCVEERWAEIPAQVRTRYRSRYQCQHCADSKTPIVHRRSTTRTDQHDQAHGVITTTRSILLVDDFRDGLEMYQEYLTYRGFHVVTARNGEETVAQARLHRPDVILLDLRMPRMTGTEALRVLRADPWFVNTPIIALTAHALDGERRLALDAGFDELIAKPCLPDALVEAVERIVRARSAQRRADVASSI